MTAKPTTTHATAPPTTPPASGTMRASLPVTLRAANEVLPIHIRAANDNDTNYMRKTWLQSCRTPWSPMQSALGPRDYWEGQHRLVTRLLATCDVRVAASNDNVETIAGWSCVEPSKRAIHFVFVREELRRYGVARMLLDGLDDGERVVWYTHRTKALDAIPLPDRFRYSFYRAVL